MEISAKPLKYASLDGLSEKQLKEHHDVLYAGYVKKYNEIQSKLKGLDVSDANATFSMIRELKLEETFALNAIKLHEGYFGCLGSDGKCKGRILQLIENNFSSFDEWKKQFMAMGISARGWVVLAYDRENKILRNILCDVHNQGGIWNCVPLLILDVYEHAYFIDYATNRKAYIDAFMKNIDWSYAEKIIDIINL